MSSGAAGDAVSVFASPNMNNGNAVELDLLFVKTYDIVQAFDIVPAKNWFRNREAFLASYVGQIESISRTVLPGEEIVLSRFPAMKRTAAAVFIYANYKSRGKHRTRVRRLRNVVVELGVDGFLVNNGSN
ncbi:MAG: hypothetical protein ACRBF0_19215 [Calditrichia bacterium]